MKKYIFYILFCMSISLYSKNNIEYSGNVTVLRDNKRISIEDANTITDKDIIYTSDDGVLFLSINNKDNFYVSRNSSIGVSNNNVVLINGAVYKKSKPFDSIEDFKKYDETIKIYSDPSPFYAGKVGNIYITSRDELSIIESKLLGSTRPIVKFFEVKNNNKNVKVYKSTFGIYVGAQDKNYKFESEIKLKDKTTLFVALSIKLDFTPPPPKPSQIQGVTKTMQNIISNPQKSKEERELLQKVYTTYTKTNYADNVYIIPAQGRYSSKFGAFRGYTRDYARYHQGFDIANTNGSPIYAANNGVVVVSRELFVRGNCVVIDHGEGIYSSYFHMSKLIAKEGQYVKKGELIGLIGSTGMSTGPHCHWEMRAGNITFDPLSILDKSLSFNEKVYTRIK